MKLIELSKNGKKNAGKYFAMVDDCDYDMLTQWNWSAAKRGNTIYASRRQYMGGGRANAIYVTIEMPRIILKVTDRKIFVDHIDGNGLNNQRSNIRLATQQQNCCNKKPKGVSKYIGVSLRKGSGRWHSQIRAKDGVINLGYYKTEIEAAEKYDEAAKKHHGEFANLNFK